MLHFHSWQTFLQMGGYAWYVWSAYLFVALFFILFAFKSHFLLTQALRRKHSPSPTVTITKLYVNKTPA